MTEKKTAFFELNKKNIVITVLMLLVLVVYGQTVGFEFINFDDNIYVYQNPFVTNGLTRDNVYWALTAFHSSNWHPLTWLSHQLDATLFGLNAGSHHATNVIFHLINTILALTVFHRFTGSFWKSAIVAALFAMHPAHVESVAWVAERKDVLSTTFWLLTMLAYLHYAREDGETGRQGDGETGRQGDGELEIKSAIQNPKSKIENRKSHSAYLGVLGLFALGLMAKPMLVTLPFVLLLLDFWPLERLKNRRDLLPLVFEKIPFFVLTAASAVITFMAQKAGGAVKTLEVFPVETRFFNAVVSYVRYIFLSFYPVDLAVWYPYDKDLPLWQVLGACLILIAVTGVSWHYRKQRKYLLVGWLWFLGTLVPVIGLVQVGLQSLADRYTYIPFFGLFIMVVWGAGDLFQKFKVNKNAAVILPVAIILIFTALSFRQVSRWRDDETLFRHSIAVTEGNYMLMQNFCYALTLAGRLDEAEQQCRDSIAANPQSAEAYNSLGIIQLKRALFTEAAASFEGAVAASPNFAMYKVNLAIAYSELGKTEEAEKSLREAAALLSYKQHTEIWVDAIKTLAIAYARQDNFEKSEENFVRVLAIAPNDTDIKNNFALLLYAREKYDEARRQIEASLRQQPDQPAALNIYGAILIKQNKREEAIRQFERALQLNPELTEARESLKKLNEGNKK